MDCLNKHLRRAIWVASVVAPASSVAADALSIDCHAASLDPSEHAVCSSPALMKLDRDLAKHTQALPDPEKLIPTPSDWAHDRARCNASERCLRALYTVRIEDVVLAEHVPAPSVSAGNSGETLSEDQISESGASASESSAIEVDDGPGIVMPMVVIALILVALRAAWAWTVDRVGRCPKCKVWRARRYIQTKALVKVYECVACSHGWVKPG